MKIVVLDGHTENPGDLSWSKLGELGDLTVYDRTAASQIIERIGDASAVIVNKVPIKRATLDACPSIKYVGVLATGYNVVDVDACKDKGIPVCNIPSYGTTAVAQHAFALLLEICHHVGHHSQSVHSGGWSSNPDWCYWDYPLIELAGKTIGILGFGRIGQATAVIARAFGMEVLACDENPNDSGRALATYLSFSEMISRADIISLHCPLLPSTQGVINKDSIAAMKDGVILINTSRGPLIVEEDLRDALQSGKIFGAALDVVSAEPIPADSVLLGQENCIITPHIAWAPKESRQRLMDIAVENLRRFCSGSAINVVNS